MTADKILTESQVDIEAKLLSEDELATINVISQRKLLSSSEAKVSEVWSTARGGKIGTGIMVGMPYLDNERGETGMSEANLCVPLFMFEHPDTAQTTDLGSGKTAEELGLISRRLLRGFGIEGKNISFFTEGKSLTPAAPPKDIEDVICYQLLIKAVLVQAVAVRCAIPSISEAALTVTLTNQTSGATIYYTIDGSFPGSGNAAAIAYTVPFLVTSGTVVRWAAYKTGLSGSITGQATIT